MKCEALQVLEEEHICIREQPILVPLASGIGLDPRSRQRVFD